MPGVKFLAENQMIDRHYVNTVARYVDELARKSARIVHTGATPQLMREVAILSKTVTRLAEASLDDGSSPARDGNYILDSWELYT